MLRERIRKMVFLALLVAMASVTHYLEGFLPVLIPAMPGAKLGLANVFSLYALIALGPSYGFTVVATRCLLVSVVWGTPISLAYSLAGGMISTLVMWIVISLFKDKTSIIGVSVAGAFFHNVGQLSVAALILNSGYVFGYLPIMTVIAIPTGVFIGLVTRIIKRNMDKTSIMNFN